MLRGLPVVIIGLGLVALIGITAFALLRRGASPPPAAPTAAPGPPAPTPPAPEATPPAPEPPAAAPAEPAPAPEPVPPERKPEPRARPPERRLEKRAEAKPADRKAEPARAAPALAPDAAAGAESRDPGQGEATGLSRDEVNKVVSANRKAFDACIASAAGSEVKLDGRPVALRITINTNGTVTYPALDEPALNSTEMGQCLKSAARLMIFPKFKGEPFQYAVPLALAGD